MVLGNRACIMASHQLVWAQRLACHHLPALVPQLVVGKIDCFLWTGCVCPWEKSTTFNAC